MGALWAATSECSDPTGKRGRLNGVWEARVDLGVATLTSLELDSGSPHHRFAVAVAVLVS